jgi:hypothetical protein
MTKEGRFAPTEYTHPSFPPQPANTAQVGGPDSLEWGTRLVALRVVLELALVVLFGLCLWAPWNRSRCWWVSPGLSLVGKALVPSAKVSGEKLQTKR